MSKPAWCMLFSCFFLIILVGTLYFLEITHLRGLHGPFRSLQHAIRGIYDSHQAAAAAAASRGSFVFSDNDAPMRVFVAVFSASAYPLRRQAVRNSWMRYEPVETGQVVVRFMVAHSDNPQVQANVEQEAKTFGDIVQLKHRDSYRNLTLTLMETLVYFSKVVNSSPCLLSAPATSCNFDYIFKCDDDTYVRIPEVMKLLESIPRAEALKDAAIGRFYVQGEVIRDEKNTAYYVSPQQFRPSHYPPYMSGVGYVLSTHLATTLAHMIQTQVMRDLKIEDATLGTWLGDMQNFDFPLMTRNVRFGTGPDDCFTDFFILHYVKEPQLVKIFRNDLKGVNISCPRSTWK